MEDLSDLKAGDKVILIERCWGGDIESIRKIDKITPTGLIKIGCNYFRPSGSIRATGVYSHIERCTKEKEDKIKKKKAERIIINHCKNELKKVELDYEKAKKILEILKGE